MEFQGSKIMQNSGERKKVHPRFGVTATVSQEHKPQKERDHLLSPWYTRGPTDGNCVRTKLTQTWHMLIDVIHLSTYQGDMCQALDVRACRDHQKNPQTSSPLTEEETEAHVGQLTCPGLTPGMEQDSHPCWPDAKVQHVLSRSPC